MSFVDSLFPYLTITAANKKFLPKADITTVVNNSVTSAVTTNNDNIITLITNSTSDKIPITSKGQADGICALNGNGIVTKTQLSFDSDDYMAHYPLKTTVYTTDQIASMMTNKINVTSMNQVNGVCALNSSGTVIKSQLNFDVADYSSFYPLKASVYTTTQINTMLTGKLDVSLLNQANGVCGLDAGGKVNINMLPTNIMQYLGVWNASTNTPALANGTGNIGDIYIVSTAGTWNSIAFGISDWIIYNGATWQKSDATDDVVSVHGRIGVVTAQQGDYSSFYPLIANVYDKSSSDAKYALLSSIGTPNGICALDATSKVSNANLPSKVVGDYSSFYPLIGNVYTTAQISTMLTGKLDVSLLNQANGICALDATSKVSNANLPSKVVGDYSSFYPLIGNVYTTAQINTMLTGKLDVSLLNQANGICALDATSKVSNANLPSKVAGDYSSFYPLIGNVYTTAQINTMMTGKLDVSLLNQANGVCGLDAGGKVNINMLPTNIMQYLGVWNASTNTPALANGTGNTGDIYIVSTAGTWNSITFGISDWIIYNGSTWQKSDATDDVVSVHGRIGVVTAQQGDYSSFYPLIADVYPKSYIDSTFYDMSTMTGLLNTKVNTSTLASYPTTGFCDAKYQFQSNMSNYFSTASNYLMVPSGTPFRMLGFSSGGNKSVALNCTNLNNAAGHEITFSFNPLILADSDMSIGSTDYGAVRLRSRFSNGGGGNVGASNVYMMESQYGTYYYGQVAGTVATNATTYRTGYTFNNGYKQPMTHQWSSGANCTDLNYTATIQPSTTMQLDNYINAYKPVISQQNNANGGQNTSFVSKNQTITDNSGTVIKMCVNNSLTDHDTNSAIISYTRFNSTVSKYALDMSYAGTSTRTNAYLCTNTSGVNSHNFNGSVSFDDVAPLCAIAPVAGGSLCNKTYVDSVTGGASAASLYVAQAPKMRATSYYLTALGLTVSTMTANYYEYALAYTNNASYNWSNFVYPAKKIMNTSDLITSDTSPYNRVHYFAFEFATAANVTPDASFMSSLMGGLATLQLESYRDFGISPTFYVNGMIYGTTSFLFNTKVAGGSSYYSTTSALTVDGTGITWPASVRVANVCVFYRKQGGLMFEYFLINQSTNALFYHGATWIVNPSHTGPYGNVLTNFATVQPALMIDTTKALTNLRVYHTLTTSMISAVNSDVTSGTIDWNNSINVFAD